jgi:hypothetical protein
VNWKLSACGALALWFVTLGAAAEEGVGAYKVDASFLKGKHSLHVTGPAANPSAAARRAGTSAAIAQSLKTAQFSNGIPGIDGVVNFTGSFNAFGLDGFGNPHPDTWYFAFVGNAPSKGTTDDTHVGAPIIPVTIQMLDAKGHQAFDPDTGAKLKFGPHDHIADVLASPVFSNYLFTSSSTRTQYTDAIHRAQFFDDIDQGWHTMLVPSVAPGYTMKVPFGAYAYALNADGTCCLFVLIDDATFGALLFPATFPVDNTTVMGAAELSGVATTKRITTMLFPDTYLFIGGDLNNCCILGFHTFDEEPGTKANGNLPRLYTAIYASWVTPGLFGDPMLGFQDVVALSHEMSETFDDPFVVFDGVHNLTPWWFSGGNCQDDLETGDVVEGLATNVTFPIAGKNGFLYHPQNVALLQWFAFQAPSTALGGAYSYPDPGALPALSPPIKPVFDANGVLIACKAIKTAAKK